MPLSIFFGAFDHVETEISARYIVRFCQEKGNWQPFSYEEINDYYRQLSGKTDGFTFNRLVEPGATYKQGELVKVGGGWIIHRTDGLYEVTDKFIRQCYMSSPLPKATH